MPWRPRPSMSGGRKEFIFSGVPVTGQPRGTGPDLLNTSYTLTADIDVPQGGGEGMIVTDGGRFGGYGMYPPVYPRTNAPRDGLIVRSECAIVYQLSRREV